MRTQRSVHSKISKISPNSTCDTCSLRSSASARRGIIARLQIPYSILSLLFTLTYVKSFNIQKKGKCFILSLFFNCNKLVTPVCAATLFWLKALLCFRGYLRHQHSNLPGKRQRTAVHHENQHIRYIYRVQCNRYRRIMRLVFLRHSAYCHHQNQSHLLSRYHPKNAMQHLHRKWHYWGTPARK